LGHATRREYYVMSQISKSISGMLIQASSSGEVRRPDEPGTYKKKRMRDVASIKLKLKSNTIGTVGLEASREIRRSVRYVRANLNIKQRLRPQRSASGGR
jgi:hypothetical protein